MACCMTVSAQEVQKSELQKSAEAALERSAPVTSRHQYIRAYEDYFNKVISIFVPMRTTLTRES